MRQYLDMLQHILDHGELTPTRAKLASTGKNVDALSIFGYQMRFDLSEGFPIVTTKKIPFKSMAHELLWFANGSTNVEYLHQNGINIWDSWVGKDGTIGNGYGKQWRAWNKYEEETIVNPDPNGFFKEIQVIHKSEVDQIANIINGINEVKKDSTASCGRRLILSAWNVGELDKMNLQPCHCFAQFSVRQNKLSCHLYQRSGDTYIGVPWNISSYALLTHLLANVTELEVGELIHSFGDAHIYINHIPQVKEQLTRTPFPLPTLKVCPHMKGANPILKFGMINDFTLKNYQCYGSLPGEVAI